MKSTVLLVLTLAVLAVSALPALPQEYLEYEQQASEASLLGTDDLLEQGETGGVRLKRATCDALSFQSKWLTPKHAGCALHCIAKGYRGGSCKNTICRCRR